MSENLPPKSAEECTEILHDIFAGNEALLNAIAPEGWAKSQYVCFFHPTAEQQFAEYNRISNNIARLSKKEETNDSQPHKAIADFQQDNLEKINGREEFVEIFAKAIWDIFSDNHEVFASDGTVYNLGSFRGASSTLADFLNEYYASSKGTFDYMDFYMGTIWISGRASLLPFYRHIFTVLKENNCNWRYSFPRLGIVNFVDEKNENTDPAKTTYNKRRHVILTKIQQINQLLVMLLPDERPMVSASFIFIP